MSKFAWEPAGDDMAISLTDPMAYLDKLTLSELLARDALYRLLAPRHRRLRRSLGCPDAMVLS